MYLNLCLMKDISMPVMEKFPRAPYRNILMNKIANLGNNQLIISNYYNYPVIMSFKIKESNATTCYFVTYTQPAGHLHSK